MHMTLEQLGRLQREVSLHKKKVRIMVDYDGSQFHVTLEKISLSAEEFMMLGERKVSTEKHG